MSYRPNPNGRGERPELQLKYNRIMAKSKSGGTRSYIRGRVGADVYSIGKDGLGKKQQVVRSLAETVANPQTESQMRGRMIMSTVMQAVAGMSAIVDHSFDGIPKGQPSISEFIRRNYALIKADVAAHPASMNEFALNAYQEKGIKAGPYVISSGSVVFPAALALNTGNPTIADLTAATTVGQLKSLLGITNDDYLTICAIEDGVGFYFARLNFNPAVLDTATVAASVATLFIQEGNKQAQVTFEDGDEGKMLVIKFDIAGADYGAIVSKKDGDGYKHTDSVMNSDAAGDDNADEVLPTYPQGNALFLNGGDL